MTPIPIGGLPILIGDSLILIGGLSILIGASPIPIGAKPILIGDVPILIGATPTLIGMTAMLIGALPILIGDLPTPIGVMPIPIGVMPILIGASPIPIGATYPGISTLFLSSLCVWRRPLPGGRECGWERVGVRVFGRGKAPTPNDFDGALTPCPSAHPCLIGPQHAQRPGQPRHLAVALLQGRDVVERRLEAARLAQQLVETRRRSSRGRRGRDGPRFGRKPG